MRPLEKIIEDNAVKSGITVAENLLAAKAGQFIRSRKSRGRNPIAGQMKATQEFQRTCFLIFATADGVVLEEDRPYCNVGKAEGSRNKNAPDTPANT